MRLFGFPSSCLKRRYLRGVGHAVGMERRQTRRLWDAVPDRGRPGAPCKRINSSGAVLRGCRQMTVWEICCFREVQRAVVCFVCYSCQCMERMPRNWRSSEVAHIGNTFKIYLLDTYSSIQLEKIDKNNLQIKEYRYWDKICSKFTVVFVHVPMPFYSNVFPWAIIYYKICKNGVLWAFNQCQGAYPTGRMCLKHTFTEWWPRRDTTEKGTTSNKIGRWQASGDQLDERDERPKQVAKFARGFCSVVNKIGWLMMMMDDHIVFYRNEGR